MMVAVTAYSPSLAVASIVRSNHVVLYAAPSLNLCLHMMHSMNQTLSKLHCLHAIGLLGSFDFFILSSNLNLFGSNLFLHDV